jgi:hypothetical protein
MNDDGEKAPMASPPSPEGTGGASHANAEVNPAQLDTVAADGATAMAESEAPALNPTSPAAASAGAGENAAEELGLLDVMVDEQARLFRVQMADLHNSLRCHERMTG